jgi:large subunit ribosomal protein L17
MRHLKHRSELSRTKEHRVALLANLSAALLTHGRIRTGLAKAKALRPYVERVITLAVRASKAETPADKVHLRRQAVARIRDKEAVTVLFGERVKEFTSRAGGYTRIYKLGRRTGDGAEMAIIELIGAADTGYAKKGAQAAKAEEAPAAVVQPEQAPAAAEAATAEAPQA